MKNQSETTRVKFAGGLLHLKTAVTELRRAVDELNEVNEFMLCSKDAPITLMEWGSLLRHHRQLEKTYRALHARAAKGAQPC